MRTCKDCKQEKPDTEFSKHWNGYWMRRCDACGKKFRSMQNLRDKFGMTVAEYEAMLSLQGGRCAICQTENPGGRNADYFNVDHCHEHGHVRGLLCAKCNLLLGNANDSIERLERAADYLRRNQP